MGNLKFLKGLETNLPDLNSREVETFYVTTDTGKLILGENVWQANLSLDAVILESARTDTNYILYMNGSEIFSVPIMRWDIEYNLLGCTLQSNSKSVNEIRDIEHGTNFYATIVKDSEEHEFKECKILVGGVDKTSECFDSTTMSITINNVKANILITVIFEEISDMVGYVNSDRQFFLYEDKLSNGTYKLYYEDENNNILDSFGIITDEATI